MSQLHNVDQEIAQKQNLKYELYGMKYNDPYRFKVKGSKSPGEK